MSNKYLDTAGVQRLVQKLSQHMGEGGGGGGSGGRIKLVGTEADPIVLDELTEPESYVISGVIEGLPDELEALLSDLEVTDFRLFFNVSATLDILDDGEDLLFLTHEIHFVDVFAYKPTYYQRTGLVMDGGESYTEWVRITPAAQAECRLKVIGTLNEVFVQNTLNPLEYTMAFEDENFPDTALIEDVIFMNDIDIGDALYPQIRWSNTDSMLDRLTIGRAYRYYSRIDDLYSLGSIVFNDEQVRDYFFSEYGSFRAYVIYNNSYVLEE